MLLGHGGNADDADRRRAKRGADADRSYPRHVLAVRVGGALARPEERGGADARPSLLHWPAGRWVDGWLGLCIRTYVAWYLVLRVPFS